MMTLLAPSNSQRMDNKSLWEMSMATARRRAASARRRHRTSRRSAVLCTAKSWRGVLSSIERYWPKSSDRTPSLLSIRSDRERDTTPLRTHTDSWQSTTGGKVNCLFSFVSCRFPPFSDHKRPRVFRMHMLCARSFIPPRKNCSTLCCTERSSSSFSVATSMALYPKATYVKGCILRLRGYLLPSSSDGYLLSPLPEVSRCFGNVGNPVIYRRHAYRLFKDTIS